MRVNISYSVDLEQIPKEVCKLLAEAEMIMENEASVYFDDVQTMISSEKNHTASIEKIDNMRHALVKSIARLEDCSSILLSYVEVVNQQRQENHKQMLLRFGEELIDE